MYNSNQMDQIQKRKWWSGIVVTSFLIKLVQMLLYCIEQLMSVKYCTTVAYCISTVPCCYCFVIILYVFHSAVSAMKAKATKKKGRGVTDVVDEGPTGGALRC